MNYLEYRTTTGYIERIEMPNQRAKPGEVLQKEAVSSLLANRIVELQVELDYVKQKLAHVQEAGVGDYCALVRRGK